MRERIRKAGRQGESEAGRKEGMEGGNWIGSCRREQERSKKHIIKLFTACEQIIIQMYLYYIYKYICIYNTNTFVYVYVPSAV